MEFSLAYLREFNFLSMVVRLLLAAFCGGVIGYGRTKKQRAAGMRTYMLISIGGAMSVLISLYMYEMLHGAWVEAFTAAGSKFDASRLAAQVLTGIGFLCAGIIIKIEHQQVLGLTTATGLFATVCLSIAAGVGFYEVVVLTTLVIILVLNVMTPLEIRFKRRLRNITLNVEFQCVDDIHTITQAITAEDATVYDIDVEQTEDDNGQSASAIFVLQLSRENHSHSGMLSTVAELPCVYAVNELIS